MTPSDEVPEIAFYYPGHLWRSGDWIKSLLLFFDGIGLLVPRYKRGEAELVDPVIAQPLIDRRLLHILEPEEHVNREATERLASAMTDIITSGALGPLTRANTAFSTLSYSRLGGYGDAGLADMIHDELKRHGLARDSEDGVSIPMHPLVRALILTLLAQILRPAGVQIGAELSPATDQPDVVDALKELLSLAAPTSGHVVASDLRVVGVDLSAVPIDEVLSFREEHRAEFRAYARSVRSFVRQMSLMPEAERRAELAARRAEIEEMAKALERTSVRSWGHGGAFLLAVAGSAIGGIEGSVVGAALGIAAEMIRGVVGNDRAMTSYSYLFRARRTYT